MTGKFSRSMASFVLAGLTAMAPVAPVYGQQDQVPPAPGQAQTPMPNQAPTQNPPPAPQPMRTLTVSVGPDYTKAQSAFPHFLWPYTPIQVPQPQFTNGPKIQQLIRDGKLSLSLQDALELALENNADIAVQRYYTWIADTDILRTRGGGAQRGVGGVVNTPGLSAALPTLSYDPLFTLNTNLDSRKAPANNPLTSGVGTSAATVQSLGTHTLNANFAYSQAFHTGTSISVSFNNNRQQTTSGSVFFNPFVQSTGTIAFSQPLLNGFGLFVNERFIRVALITKRAVDYAFQQSLINDLTSVQNAYWELVFARGNVVVQQHAVDLAQTLYNDNRRQVEIGTLAPLEVVRAEAQVATAQQALIAAQTAQLQDQIVLMSVITKDPYAPEVRNVEIVPTDTPQVPPPIEEMPLTDALTEATQNRPDILQSKINLEVDDINVKATRNALLPSLTLSGFATSVGLGGNNKITTSAPGNGTLILAPGNAPVQVINNLNGQPTTLILPNVSTTTVGINQGGFGDALSMMFHNRFPEYQAQVTLTVPIRNRVAQADSTRAILSQRQDQTRYQQVLNNVTVDVHNAQVVFQQARGALVAAQKARQLQEQTLDADQRRLQLGASTIFVVVTDQQNLAIAAAAEVRAEVNLAEARVNFERALGRTLTANRITIADATSGTVSRDSLIPGTTAGGDLIGLKEAFAQLPN